MRMLLIGFASIGIAAMVAGGPALAADLPVVRAPGAKPACVRVSDCQTCRRVGGELVCSNIGIACQPRTFRCL